MSDKLDKALSAVVGGVMHNNLIESREACNGIHDMFYQQTLNTSRRLNTLEAYFLCSGKHDVYIELLAIADNNRCPPSAEWNALCLR